MPGIADLAKVHTQLRGPEVDHLIGLVGSWGLLADLCFSDLMLFASVGHPADGEGAERFIVLSQVRPTTGQTLYKTDWIGRVVTDHERPLVARCMSLGEIIAGEVPNDELRELVRVLCIPVRREGRTVAVMTREAASSVGRHTGELERTYVEVFHRFARMIATGEFPFRTLDELIARNGAVAQVFADLGFALDDESADGATRWVLEVDRDRPEPNPYISRREPSVT